MQTEIEHIRLKGAISKRGPYIETKLYDVLVDRIVTCIITQDNRMVTSDEMIKTILANPPCAMDESRLTWIVLQVKNDLLFKKLLSHSFEEFTQKIRLTLEGEIFFGLR